MRTNLARALLALSSIVLIFGGAMHAMAFAHKATSILDAARLPIFFVKELKVLWLADSTTLIGVGAAYAVAAIAPRLVPVPALLLLAAIPTATMVLLYGFLGSFYAAHLLALASAMVLAAAALQVPVQADRTVRAMLS